MARGVFYAADNGWDIGIENLFGASQVSFPYYKVNRHLIISAVMANGACRFAATAIACLPGVTLRGIISVWFCFLQSGRACGSLARP